MLGQSIHFNHHHIHEDHTDWIRLYLMAYVTSLEQQVTLNFTAFATSAFSAHSLVATVAVVQGVVLCIFTVFPRLWT